METARALRGKQPPARLRQVAGGARPALARWWLLLVGLFLWGGCAAAPRRGTATPWLPPTPAQTVSPAASATPLPLPTPSPLAATAALSPAPAFTATPPAAACLRAGGNLVRAALPSRYLTYKMPVLVYLPPCYEQQPDRRYPVLYLIHGQNFDQTQWARLGAPAAADRLIAAGEAPPFIIVMPGERSWEQPRNTGWDETFLQVLMPWVEAHFRTRNDRRDRAIGGLSRGASWAIHLGLSHWELFGSIGGHSPPVFWEDVPHIRAWLQGIPPGKWPRIYLDIGDADQHQITESARWFEGVLTKEGIPHEWHFNVGRHNEAYWSRHVEAYLRWYVAPWKTEGR